MKHQTLEIEMENICENYQRLLFHVAYGITRDHYLAQDVVQETYIKAYRKIDTISDESKLCSWLAAIAARTAIDFVRKEKRRREVLESEFLLKENCSRKNVEEEVDLRLFVQEISKALDELNDRQKAILFLKVNKGMKEKEIADVLQLNPNNVKTILYRVRRKLILILREENYA